MQENKKVGLRNVDLISINFEKIQLIKNFILSLKEEILINKEGVEVKDELLDNLIMQFFNIDKDELQRERAFIYETIKKQKEEND